MTPDMPARSDLVTEAITYFGLDVVRADVGDDSYSSTVRLLTLASGERVVLKIPWRRHKLLREAAALHALAHTMPVPAVLDIWAPGNGSVRPGAILLSFLPGTVVTGPVTLDLARQMGALLARLHRHPRDHFGDEGDRDDSVLGWWALLRRYHDIWCPHCTTVLPPAFWRKVRDSYEQLYADLPAPDGPCWVHSDYRPGNILTTTGAPVTISGLIDFESARGGSADYDFVKMSHAVFDLVPGSRDAFCAGYAAVRPVPDIERTLPFYRLHNAIGGVAWCVRRTTPADPFFRENLTVIEDMVGRTA